MATLKAGPRWPRQQGEPGGRGDLVIAAARQSGAAMIPVDSEHSALFQSSWPAGRRPPAPPTASCSRLSPVCWMPKNCCSRGPAARFRGLTRAELPQSRATNALKHPPVHGSQDHIDSASLMKQGSEVIEAHYLFGVPYERIRVLVTRSRSCTLGAFRRRRRPGTSACRTCACPSATPSATTTLARAADGDTSRPGRAHAELC